MCSIQRLVYLWTTSIFFFANPSNRNESLSIGCTWLKIFQLLVLDHMHKRLKNIQSLEKMTKILFTLYMDLCLYCPHLLFNATTFKQYATGVYISSTFLVGVIIHSIALWRNEELCISTFLRKQLMIVRESDAWHYNFTVLDMYSQLNNNEISRLDCPTSTASLK